MSMYEAESAEHWVTQYMREHDLEFDVDVESAVEDMVASLRQDGYDLVGPALFVPSAIDLPWYHYGVAFSEISEDGDRMLALGHVADRRLFAALNRHWRTEIGIDAWERNAWARGTTVRHNWAYFRRAAGDAGWEWTCSFEDRPSGSADHNRFFCVPVTVWER